MFPITALYDDFADYNKDKKPFFPQHLESSKAEERSVARETVLNYMKHVVQISNSNLNRNAKSLVIENKISDVVGMDVDVLSQFKTTY